MMSDDPAFVTEPPAAAARLRADCALPVFRQVSSSPAADHADLELIVSIELGRVRMRLSELLQMTDGSVLELNKLAGDAVDVVVNDQLVARGEVVVLNDKFAVRISQVMPAAREA